MKRAFDLILSSIALIALSPLLLGIAILIKLDSNGPVFYRGERVGRHGKVFKIFKFRSMVADAELKGGLSTSDKDPRITRVGAYLRRFKLDELPQFLNVFKGEMSLVGPRPEVKEYMVKYRAEKEPTLAVRPGITDWATIWNSDEGGILKDFDDPDKAYEELIFPIKLKLQQKYCKQRSFLTDLKILFYTAAKMLNPNFTPRELRSYPNLQALSESYRNQPSSREDMV